MDERFSAETLHPKYKRVILKISGEGFGHSGKSGISIDETLNISGHPFVTTDTAAALRARELEADVLLKATRVDGVYSEDPELNPHAVRYEKLTYAQVVRDNLRVMDMSAIDLCRLAKLPILVFNFKRQGNIDRAIAGHPLGTVFGEPA